MGAAKYQWMTGTYRPLYFIISHPIQYFIPLYQKLSAKENLFVKVLYCSDETVLESIDKDFGVKVRWDIPLLEGYNYTFLRNYSPKPSIFNGFWGICNPGIWKELCRLPKGLVIISGWQYASYVFAYLAAKACGHQVAIRCEAPKHLESQKVGPRHRLRKVLIRIILHRFVDYYLYIGNQNQLFYKSYDIPDDKLYFVPYSIDESRFREETVTHTKREIRNAHGIDNSEFVVLFTGKLIERKRPLDLIEAFRRARIVSKKLIIVGDGPLRSQIECYIEKHLMTDILLVGFINQQSIVKYYKMSDVLVLCSREETWGLSVNEAMACGLPVIVSDTVGCADDLVETPYGRVFPMGDIKALSRKLEEMHEAILENGDMKQRIYEKIQKYSLNSTADNIASVASL